MFSQCKMNSLEMLKKVDENTYIILIKGVLIELNEDVFTMVTRLPKGMKQDKEDKYLVEKDKKQFSKFTEQYQKVGGVVKRY